MPGANALVPGTVRSSCEAIRSSGVLVHAGMATRPLLDVRMQAINGKIAPRRVDVSARRSIDPAQIGDYTMGRCDPCTGGEGPARSTRRLKTSGLPPSGCGQCEQHLDRVRHGRLPVLLRRQGRGWEGRRGRSGGPQRLAADAAAGGTQPARRLQGSWRRCKGSDVRPAVRLRLARQRRLGGGCRHDAALLLTAGLPSCAKGPLTPVPGLLAPRPVPGNPSPTPALRLRRRL